MRSPALFAAVLRRVLSYWPAYLGLALCCVIWIVVFGMDPKSSVDLSVGGIVAIAIWGRP